MKVKCPHCEKEFDLEQKLTCLRCGHEWYAKDPSKLPKVCPNPKCKSPYWDRERTKKKTESTNEEKLYK